MTRQDKKLLESYRELLEEFRIKLEDTPDTEYQRIKAVILFIKERLVKPLEVAEEKLEQPSKREYL